MPTSAARAPGLKLGVTEVSWDRPGGPAAVLGSGSYAGQPFTAAGTVGVPLHPDGRGTLPVDLTLHGAPAGGKAASGSLTIKGGLAVNKLGFDGVEVAAALRTPALAALRHLLAPGLPALTAVAFDGRLTVPASAASIRFKDAALRSGPGRHRR